MNKYCRLKVGTASKLSLHALLCVDQSSYNLLCSISFKDKLHSRRSRGSIFPISWTENVQHLVEGSLEAKLPTIWRDENAVQLRRSSEMQKVRREKLQVREKVGKSRNTVFYHCFVAAQGRKVGSLKRRVRSQLSR